MTWLTSHCINISRISHTGDSHVMSKGWLTHSSTQPLTHSLLISNNGIQITSLSLQSISYHNDPHILAFSSLDKYFSPSENFLRFKLSLFIIFITSSCIIWNNLYIKCLCALSSLSEFMAIPSFVLSNLSLFAPSLPYLIWSNLSPLP